MLKYAESKKRIDLLITFISFNILLMTRPEAIFIGPLILLYIFIKTSFTREHYFLFALQAILILLFFIPLPVSNSDGNLCDDCWTFDTLKSNVMDFYDNIISHWFVFPFLILALFAASLVICLKTGKYRLFTSMLIVLALIYSLFYLSWKPESYGAELRYNLAYLWILFIIPALGLDRIISYLKRYKLFNLNAGRFFILFSISLIMLMIMSLPAIPLNNSRLPDQAHPPHNTVFLPYTVACVDAHLEELPSKYVVTLDPHMYLTLSNSRLIDSRLFFNEIFFPGKPISPGDYTGIYFVDFSFQRNNPDFQTNESGEIYDFMRNTQYFLDNIIEDKQYNLVTEAVCSENNMNLPKHAYNISFISAKIYSIVPAGG